MRLNEQVRRGEAKERVQDALARGLTPEQIDASIQVALYGTNTRGEICAFEYALDALDELVSP